MSNVKISALPLSTGTTFNDWVIKNNSGETITEKAQLKDVLGMTSLNGNNAIQSQLVMVRKQPPPTLSLSDTKR